MLSSVLIVRLLQQATGKSWFSQTPHPVKMIYTRDFLKDVTFEGLELFGYVMLCLKQIESSPTRSF